MGSQQAQAQAAHNEGVQGTAEIRARFTVIEAEHKAGTLTPEAFATECEELQVKLSATDAAIALGRQLNTIESREVTVVGELAASPEPAIAPEQATLAARSPQYFSASTPDAPPAPASIS